MVGIIWLTASSVESVPHLYITPIFRYGQGKVPAGDLFIQGIKNIRPQVLSTSYMPKRTVYSWSTPLETT